MKCILAMTIWFLTNLTFGQVTSQTDTLPSGELILKQEILINTSVEKVWNAFTTPEGWTKWVTPIVEMDFKINGTIITTHNLDL
jgi:hypothetical protein